MKLKKNIEILKRKVDLGPLHVKSQQEIVIFYNEILTGKVVLWCFFTSETSKKSTIQLF